MAGLLMGVMLCTVLSGCGNKGGETAPVQSGAGGSDDGSGLKGTVDIFQFKVEINDALKAVTQTYMAANPGVKINLETVGGGSDYGAALRTKMQSSDKPEIYNIGGPQDLKDWENSLEDLSSEPWVSNTVAGLLDDVTTDSKVYGLPMAIEGYGFIYNKGIFEAAGIDVSSLKTFNEIDKAFGDLKAKIDNGDLQEKYPVLEAVIEYPVKEKWVTGMHTSNVALGQEFKSSTEAYNAKEVSFTYGEQLKEIIDMQVKYTSSAENPMALNAVDYSMQLGGGFAIERVAVIQQGNWIYPEALKVDEAVANNMGIIPIPLKGVSEGNIPVGVPMYWAVNSTSSDQDKACAKDFLNWLYQSEEGKKMIVDEFNFIPSFTNFGDIKPSDSVGATINEAANAGTVAPWVFNGCPTSWAENILGAEIQSYVGGEKTWEQVIETAKSTWADARK